MHMFLDFIFSMFSEMGVIAAHGFGNWFTWWLNAYLDAHVW